jgi:hypothetical protein
MSEQRLTARQAAIVTAYTGVMAGNFPEFHKFAEEIVGNPIWTHQFASEKLVEAIKEKAKPYFLEICNDE